ncbi:hypothetical protein ACFL6H_04840 [Candidatus Latescibacterota bacterium]
MTETGFGPGDYAYTFPEVPSALEFSELTSESINVVIGDDANAAFTEYAIYNETIGFYIGSDGNPSPTAAWKSKTEWQPVNACGLDPVTEYSFKVKARIKEGSETDFGPSAQTTTYNFTSSELSFTLIVQKASSTISAPSFMGGLSTSIRIGGKCLNELGFHVDTISGLDMPNVIPEEELVPGNHTWHIWDEYFEPKRILLEGYVHGSSPGDLRLRLGYLKGFLSTFEGNPWRSTAPIWIERSDLPDRHWIAYYSSIDTVEMLGKRDLSSSAHIRVTMKCPMPFAISNDIIRTIYTPTANSFKTIDLGNAPSDAVYVIKGPATNPSFTVGDMIFNCDFSQNLTFTDTECSLQSGTFTPSENETGSYRTTETGTGILIADSDTVTFSAPGNLYDGSWIVVFAPQWQSTSQISDIVILEHKADDDNYIRLYWDASEDTWVFIKCADGVNYTVASDVQTFTSGTRIILGLTYDSTNAGGIKIFIDGVQSGVAGDTTVLSSSPSTLTLHGGNGTMQPNVVFDMVTGWSRMLSADEMLKIATDTSKVDNLNTSVSYTGTLDTNDLLTLNSEMKTAELFDISAGTRINVINTLSGTIPALIPGRRRTASDRTQTVIYSKNSSEEMEVRYVRRYL